MTKEIKITIVEPHDLEVWSDEEEAFVINFRSNFYIINSLGQYIFYHSRDRGAVQRLVDETYGKGFFTVRQAKQSTGSGNYTCTGSNSRKGFASHLKKS